MVNKSGEFRASLLTGEGDLVNVCSIENEHLNNVGKYRAVKTVPLPFNND